MKILFISKHKHPHIGGVERHVEQITNRLRETGNKVTIISGEDPTSPRLHGTSIKYPHIKIIGLLYIWFWFFKNINIIKNVDIIHVHDVFIWYLPFRFLFPRKKVYITFHGWEGKWPLPMWAIINKRLANYLCDGSIAVGNYINKYYGIKSDYVIYGAAESHGGVTSTANSLQSTVKTKNTVVWLGRTDQDTGYLEFQKWLDTNPPKGEARKFKVIYVTNAKNPEKYLKTAEYCVPSGYLSYLEAKSYGCKIMTFANNPLKEDYWNEIKRLKTIPTWGEVAKVYIKLWKA